jgi:hypothetical protein
MHEIHEILPSHKFSMEYAGFYSGLSFQRVPGSYLSVVIEYFLLHKYILF